MNVVKEIQRVNQRELAGKQGEKSWHDEYKDSPYIFIGGLPYNLNEGDVIRVFSQYGEPTHFHLVRDDATGASKGFGFLSYEDQRSTVLAVDNFNGAKLLGRTLRVDHTTDYKPPEEQKAIMLEQETGIKRRQGDEPYDSEEERRKAAKRAKKMAREDWKKDKEERREARRIRKEAERIKAIQEKRKKEQEQRKEDADARVKAPEVFDWRGRAAAKLAEKARQDKAKDKTSSSWGRDRDRDGDRSRGSRYGRDSSRRT